MRIAYLVVPVAALALAGCRTAPEAARPSLLRATSTFVIASNELGETRRINVWSPAAANGAEPSALPVLYVLDGGVDEDFVHVAEAVSAGIEWGLLRPMLVVGIENTERRRDLTGPTDVESDRRIAPRVGGAAAFRRFLVGELLPAIRSRYAVGEQRALIGESLAGLFVVDTLFAAPEMFDTYIAFDPSLGWNDRALVRGAAAWLQAHPSLHARIYLAAASEPTIVEPTRQLGEALRIAAPPGLRWQLRLLPEEYHDTIYRAAAPLALRTLFPAK